jgi:DNA-binding transcriptional ArsR family regulator
VDVPSCAAGDRRLVKEEKTNDFSSLKDNGLVKERRMGMSPFYAQGNKSRWRKRIFMFGDYTYLSAMVG